MTTQNTTDSNEQQGEAISEVAQCAQAVLTALNVGDVQSGSPLHLKLREVMIAYRERVAMGPALTDERVDAFIREHENDPVDEAQLERVRQRFKEKLASPAAASPAPASPEPTPEQIVYNVAQRDPFFRKHLIEQLSAMGDEQDTGPLKTLPAQPAGEQEIGQVLRKKRARRIIDVVIGSPCIVETRFFSQPEEQEKLESDVAVLLAQLEREQLENEIFQDATDPAWAPPDTPSATAMRAAEEIAAWIFKLETPLTSETDLRVAQDIVAAIITRRLGATPVVTGGFTCSCCQRNMELRINERFCNECATFHAATTTSPKTGEASRFNTPEEFIDAYNQAAGGEARLCLKCGHEERFSDKQRLEERQTCLGKRVAVLHAIGISGLGGSINDFWKRLHNRSEDEQTYFCQALHQLCELMGHDNEDRCYLCEEMGARDAKGRYAGGSFFDGTKFDYRRRTANR